MAHQDPAYEIQPALALGMSSTMRFFHNPSITEETTDGSNPARWSLVTYDPKPGDKKAFFVPPHWHDYHDEYWTVYEGRGKFTVDGKVIVVNAGDPTLKAAKGHIHAIDGFEGEKFVFTEAQSPVGTYKEAFFRDLYQNRGRPGRMLGYRAYWDGDTFPLITGSKTLDRMLFYVVGGISTFFAPSNPYAEMSYRVERGKENRT